MAFVAVGLLRLFQVKLTAEPYPAGLGLALFVSLLLMNLLPKIAGVADVLMQPAVRARYGGAGRVLAGFMVEFVFSLLLGPIVALRVSIFMLGLPFGRTVTWSGQMRDAERLSWRTALRGLWPQFLFGMLIFATLAAAIPSALWWAAPMLAGLLLAVPFAVWTASPGFGQWLARRGICTIPEEAAEGSKISALQEVTNLA
jgi:membrane glycosyltransferase